MPATEWIVFLPFRLDPGNEQLWRDDQLVPLPPKTFAILRYLVEHAGQLVTKEELLTTVWTGTRVSDGIIRGYIRDLRDALGDDSQAPRFIETVPRRGHRFIAPLTPTAPVLGSQFSVLSTDTTSLTMSQLTTDDCQLTTLLVGRDPELAHLHSLYAKAMSGDRQVVFVTGEPGIGKTTLVETFLEGFRIWELGSGTSPPQSPNPKSQIPEPVFWLGRGQCVEQHGAGEAYLPVLEALGRIGREPDGAQFVTILHQYAPTWLVQMPALVGTAELETLQRRVVGATRERMLREMVEAMEALAAERPLVLWLEDLHWSDASTVDWLAAIAQHRAPARLLVIGTYRPSDLSVSNHPLRAVKQELVAKGQAEELRLPFLSESEVTQYLTKRYAQQHFPPELGTMIYQRTDGNPLFVVNLVAYLAAQGVIVEVDGSWQLRTAVDEVGRGVPDSVRQLIEKHVERLSEEQQRLLEVASVVGITFSAMAAAAGAETSVEQVEAWCDELVKRGQFLQAQEPRVLPDGTLCGSYSFQHALQHAIVYERIPNLRRLRLHRRVGESEERAYGDRAHEIAAELAVHFERGGDLLRAVQFRQHAGHNALRQHGYQEAISHFKCGLELLTTFPDTAERRQHELALQVALGSPLQALYGYGAPEVEVVYTRARELSQQIGDTTQLFPVLRGLYVFYLLRGQLQIALEFGERLLSLAQSAQDPAFLLEGHFALGQALMFQGELSAAREHLEHGIALYDPERHRSHALLYGQDPGVFCRVLSAWDLGLLGYPDQALHKSQEALAIAREVAHPLSVAAAQTFFARTHQCHGEAWAAQERAEAAIELSSQQEFPFFLAFATIMRGRALAEQGHAEEGIAQLRQGIAAYRATGAELAMTRWIPLLAEAWGKAGQPETGLNLLAEALAMVNRSGEREYEAEIYRLRGELTLSAANQKSNGKNQMAKITDSTLQAPSLKSQVPSEVVREVEGYFLKSIAIAQHQQAKSLELRAVMSLVRLRQQAQHATRNTSHATRPTQHAVRTALAEAHSMLADVYNWFTEGFDTKDLQDAKALLEQLRH